MRRIALAPLVFRIFCLALFALIVDSHKPAPLKAAVISFDSLEQAGSSLVHVPSPYVESGFQISNNFLNYAQQSHFSYAGSAGLHARESDGLIVLSMIGGGLFNLTSIDLSILRPDGTSLAVSFFGYLASGSLIHQSFTPTSFGFQTSVLIGFQNLTRVEWHQGCCDNEAHQFDNIVVAPVPLPGALALLLTGLVGLGLIGRRRSRIAAQV